MIYVSLLAAPRKTNRNVANKISFYLDNALWRDLTNDHFGSPLFSRLDWPARDTFTLSFAHNHPIGERWHTVTPPSKKDQRGKAQTSFTFRQDNRPVMHMAPIECQEEKLTMVVDNRQVLVRRFTGRIPSYENSLFSTQVILGPPSAVEIKDRKMALARSTATDQQICDSLKAAIDLLNETTKVAKDAGFLVELKTSVSGTIIGSARKEYLL